MTTIGLFLLLLTFVLLPAYPGYSFLLLIVMLVVNYTIGWGDSPGNDWPAAIVFTVAAGYFIWSMIEGGLRLMGA